MSAEKWIIDAHGYDSPYLVKAFIETEDGQPIAGLYEGDGKRARLIAAAPELFAALERCVKEMQSASSLLEMFPDDYGEAINSGLAALNSAGKE